MVAKEQSGPRAFTSTFKNTFRARSRERLENRNWGAILAVAVVVGLVLATPDLIVRSYPEAGSNMLIGVGLTVLIALLQRPSQSGVLAATTSWLVVAAGVAATILSHPRTPTRDQRALLVLGAALCASIALAALRRRS